MTATRTTQSLHRPARVLGVVLLAALLGGCAAGRLQREGHELIDAGRHEEGLALLGRLAAEYPRDPKYRSALLRERERVVASQLAQADRARLGGDAKAAESMYQMVLRIEPGNARATDGLRLLELQRNLGEMAKLARAALKRGEVDQAERHIGAMLALDPSHTEAMQLRRDVDLLRLRAAQPYPQLRARFTKPVTLEFRDASLKAIFDVLSRTTGLNFVLDKDLRPDLKATIFVKQVPVEEAVELLLAQSQLEKKVVSDTTIIIYPDTPAKAKEYQDLVIRTFYLENTDAKQAQALIKAMLKSRDIFIDDRLNTLTLRDTPDAVRLAERLLEAQDQAEPEVLIEIEVLEVSRKRILDLGIQWPNSFTALNSALGPVTVLDQLKGLNSGRIGIGPTNTPQARLNASDNDVNTLATPVIRVRSKDKARIHIGDKIPIVSATSTPSTQGPVITETITYLDVGLKIEVEPTVYLNNEVGMKISLEVSNSTLRGTTASGSTLVELSTRNASTSLRLRDGETQILAGLVRNDFSNSGNKIPGLGDIPGVGRLFGSNQDTTSKTELVLSIKPRVLRNLPPLSPQQMEFASGTESTLRAFGILPTGGTEGEAVTVTAPPAPPTPPSERPDAARRGASEAPLSLSWIGDPVVQVGAETTVTLELRADQPVVSTALQIGYDPAAIEVEAIEGDLLRQDATTTFTSRADPRTGRLFISVSRTAGGGTTGSGTLLNLRVRGLAQRDAASLRLIAFSGVGPGNRHLTAPLPQPLELTVEP